MPKVHRVLFAALAGTCVALSGGLHAQAFPSKALTLVVPFPPGGVTDPVARLLGAKVTESTGQPFLIENKPGAGSIIGAESVKRAAPDGYTLFFGHFASHAVNPHIYSKLSYDPVRDFAPITPVISTMSLLVVPLNSPAKTVAELVAYGKSKPGGLSYASQGVAAGGHLLGEMLRQRTGLNLTHVPYKGSAPAVQDILEGRVDLFFDAPSTSGVQVRAGKLRALAVASPVRHAQFPDVPTMAEAGITNMEQNAWFGMFATGGTPQPVVQRLHQEMVKAARNPEVTAKITATGLNVFTLGSPEEFAKLIAADTVKYGQVVRAAKISVD
jgi:tripartite-type tricarboxylate transporter receptor subunit TctC